VVWVTVAPMRAGTSARVTLEPATTAIRLVGGVRTVAGRGTAVRARNTSDGSIQVSGSIGARSPVRRFGLVAMNPAAFTTGAFRAALLQKGVVIDGATRLGSTPGGASVLASVLSPRLEQIVAVMNRESINLYAELLLRNAARGPRRDRQGTTAAAQALLRDFYRERVGSDASTIVAADGSGLSTLDRLTSRQMVELLHHAHRAPWGPTFHASLPVAGTSELLRTRMRQSPAVGNLHAKTGTTDAVIGLAGYVTAENGEVLAFSFLYNGSDRWNARSTIDVMGETLAGFARP
jgi:D-alanyl-D-alanine carboxypeptidase/D-alanyl-D-alanine-endopeptidase (penicillin-binding protein 4)